MDSQTASKRAIRLAMAILFWVSASTAFAEQKPQGSSAAAGRPQWGTANYSVLTLAASDFTSTDDRQVTVGGNVRKCLERPPGIGQGCTLQAGVPLPSGALIEYMEFAVCDSDPDYAAAAWLYVFEGLDPAPPPAAAVITQGDGGCLFWVSSYIGVTVDNLSNTYIVQVFLNQEADAPGVSFRAVRIFYRLQVSPVPAFASFNDVPVGSTYHQFVEALYASGITVGCGGGNFCPNSSLTRGQMAVFLSKALGLHWPN